jgi:hypothetical protein
MKNCVSRSVGCCARSGTDSAATGGCHTGRAIGRPARSVLPPSKVTALTMTPLRSQVGLSALNFRVGAIQTAFGPFFTVYLTQKVWNQVDIGFSLSVGTAAALILQLPAGALIDAVHLKRVAIAVALLMTGLSALAEVTAPTEASVLVSRVPSWPLSFNGSAAIAGVSRQPANACSASGSAPTAATPHSAMLLPRRSWHCLLCFKRGGVHSSPLIVPALATLLAFRRGDLVADDHPATHHPRVRKKSQHRPAAYLPRSDPACFRGLHTPVPIRQRRDVAAGIQYGNRIVLTIPGSLSRRRSSCHKLWSWRARLGPDAWRRALAGSRSCYSAFSRCRSADCCS